ncbi:hypothetical protein [Arthrobacter sp. FW306-04-A]|uniref:hypothetical protein n=1 Tax=Arthrobacter sp. FW306-04-A TaxID=2879619 RepID=UPI0037C0C04E|nr:hypothetical protein LFT43_00910 [Arthrobacter sp. FW306-04-A]
MRRQLVHGAVSAMIAGAAVASLSGCSRSPSTASPAGTPATTVGMDASWAEGYNNLADLKAHSKLAVQGTFTRIIAQSSIKTIPVTDFEFTVDKVLHDPGHLVTAGAKLTVRQAGGTVDGVLHQIADDPLFKISENAVLFLKQPEPGLFYVVGGPSGRFEVANGKVSPFAPDGAKFSGPRQTSRRP